jgi:hypothetical protein
MDGTETRPLRDRDDLIAVLSKGFDLIEPAVPRLRYRLVGTGAACLQGVDLPVGDIDLLLARRDDIDAVAAALSHLPCVTAPQWIDVSRQYFACYSIDGVGFSFSTVEVPAEEEGWECVGPGPWRHFTPVSIGGRDIDCVGLELRLVSELIRDRPDRYRPLLAHLAGQGADLELLHQSLAVRETPEHLASLVREHLGSVLRERLHRSRRICPSRSGRPTRKSIRAAGPSATSSGGGSWTS